MGGRLKILCPFQKYFSYLRMMGRGIMSAMKPHLLLKGFLPPQINLGTARSVGQQLAH